MFEKGRSGNPLGRPRENNEVKALAREHTKEAVDRLAFWMRSDDSKASVAASIALLDRAWGRPARVHGGPDGEGPVKVVHEVVWAGSNTFAPGSAVNRVSRSSPSMIEASAGPSSSPIAEPERRLQPSMTRSNAP